MKFYTNAFVNKNKILVRGIDENGAQVKRVYDYAPYLFVKSEKETGYKTINGANVARMNFANIWESRDFIKQYKDVAGFPIYGLTDYAYTFLNDYFPGGVKFDSSSISVVSFDIENLIGSDDIATSLITTPNEVTAVTLSKNGIKHVIHTCEFTPTDDNVISYRMQSEKLLLEKFIEVWKKLNPDVITGWNIEFYDIPYIVGRIRRILGEDAVSELSPWGIVRPYEIEIQGRTLTSYEFKGIASLDYLQLYKKFTYVTRESYKLDHIAEVELDEKKLDYSDYKNLNDLYYKNPQLYIEYNIHDVVLIDKLEDKLKLIELVFAIAYDAKVNYTDTLASVKQWDVIIHNYLMDRKIVVPPTKESSSDTFEGAYVKAPIVGMHDWVVSFDLNSLYPHLSQHYNISPEKYSGREGSFPSVDELLEGNFVPPNKKYSYAANGCRYLRDNMGFLGEIMAKMYDDRNYYKALLKEQKKIFQDTKSPEAEKLISTYDNAQMAKKIQLNSAYGAIGNKYFRWFDLNHAEAITISGQFAIRWIANKLNAYLNKVCKTSNVDFIVASESDMDNRAFVSQWPKDRHLRTLIDPNFGYYIIVGS
jgi:DNA polymerase elongation subunit (family B)